MQPRDILLQATSVVPSDTPSGALLVFAHPDDETLALGARLFRFGDAHMIHVTDGAPRNGRDSQAHGFDTLDAYRQAREEELKSVLARAGVAGMSRECFGIADQEAIHCLAELARRVAARLRQGSFNLVITHPYEGGHPDHDACAFAVHQAVRLLQGTGKRIPVIVEAAFYHAGAHGINTSNFLPGTSSAYEVAYILAPDEQLAKQELIDCFASQHETLRQFSLQYERYRIAPAYDFTQAPHQGKLYYEQHDWGVTGLHFRELAAAAIRDLDGEIQGH